MNNSHLINTLQQDNQDLSQKIDMLKSRLQEERNLLKEITEERDSYRKALQIMTKELNSANKKQNDDIEITRQQQQQQQQQSHVDSSEANQVFDSILTSQNRYQALYVSSPSSQVSSERPLHQSRAYANTSRVTVNNSKKKSKKQDP